MEVKYKNIKTVSELIAILRHLMNKYGDLQVRISEGYTEERLAIDMVCYTTDDEDNKYISLNSFA